MITDPRYSYDKEKQYDIHRQIKEDVSMTFRKPYPQEHEIGLPRNNSEKNKEAVPKGKLML